eukprot:373208_1
MGSCLFKIPSQQTFESNHLFECAVYATNGARSTMEDAHAISLSFPNHPSHSFFGVFDGFNGDDASKYLSQKILSKLDTINDLEDNDAIVNALHQMDDDYIHRNDDNPQYNTNAGCTLVFALVQSDSNHSIYDHSIADHESVGTPYSVESEPLKFVAFDE